MRTLTQERARSVADSWGDTHAGTPGKWDPNASAVRNRNAVSREDLSEGHISPSWAPARGANHRQRTSAASPWDENHKPPKTTTEKAADAVLYQTKNHRLEIIDEGGKESITLMTAEGKMRFILSKDKGIELINELGDIKIECKKLKIESEKDLQIQAKKKLTIEAGEDAAYKAKKTIKITSDKEVKCKAKNIKLEGSKGVATGGKQLAKQDDKVIGFDIHQMRIPSGDGTTVVPLPHPFIGKLNDKLSKDVKIAGKNAATKGSMAKHDDSMHMQLPGTIKFENGCKKTGEVTGGTAPKVKINGKEAATIGSTVTTCNDMGMKENSTILAVGASMPMPTIINPKNMEEYKKEKDKEKTKKPQFTTVKWGKTSAKEGEEIELSAQVKDIDDGNMVTLQVWKDGQDPASGVPQAQIPTNVDGGVAKGKWAFHSFGSDEPPSDDPAYFFTAHSAWCPMKKSSNATIKLKRPELSSLEWKDDEGSSTSKGLVGKKLTLSASCNSDTDDGAGVIFRVFPDGANVEKDTPTAELATTNSGGKAEVEWSYHYEHDPENPLKEKPKYIFTVTTPNAKMQKSGNVEINEKHEILLHDKQGKALSNTKLTVLLSDSTTKSVTSDGDGKAELKDCVPGVITSVKITNDKGETEIINFSVSNTEDK